MLVVGGALEETETVSVDAEKILGLLLKELPLTCLLYTSDAADE